MRQLAKNPQKLIYCCFATALCAALLLIAPYAAADSVPASYDCKKATRTVDQFICRYAVLRWQDLALSRSYKAALTNTQGGERQVVQDMQRRWVKERDQRCVGQRNLKALQGEEANASYRCLLESYRKQRAALVDYVPNWMARGVVETRLDDIAQARLDWQAEEDHTVFGAALSPDASLLAITLPDSYNFDAPVANQVWLYRIGGNQGVAVTPKPSNPNNANGVMRIDTLAWQGTTLYVRALLWGTGDNGEDSRVTYYAATPNDRAGQLIKETPAIKALLDQAAQQQNSRLDLFPDDQDAIIAHAAWSNDKHLVWAADRGHGTVELLTQERKPGAKPYLISWGDWDLTQAVFDARNGRLLYPGDTGLKLIELDTRKEWEIVVPGALSRPLAMVAESAEMEGTRITWVEPILPGKSVPVIDAKKDQPFRILNAVLLPFPRDDE